MLKMVETEEKGNIIIYESEIRKMTENGQVSNQTSVSQSTNYNSNTNPTNDRYPESSKNVKSKIYEFLNHNLVASILLAVFVALFHDLPQSVTQLRVDVAELKGQMQGMDDKIDMLQANYTTLTEKVWGLDVNTIMRSEINDNELDYYKVNILPPYIDDIKVSHRSGDSIYETQSNLVFKDSEGGIVATSLDGKTGFTDGELMDMPILFTYEEEGEEVFFYGQFNENNKWNDHCIINKYKDDVLTFIMDAEYDDGELISYQQIFPGRSGEYDVWYLSIRSVEEDRNRGQTISYFWYGNYTKEFDSVSVKPEYILDTETFRKTIPSTIEGYYSGYTSDGYYNDDTGSAYIVKYNVFGLVRFLYVGKIKDGWPDDNTGNAWSISLGYDEKNYYYYKGTFTNKTHDTPPDPWNPMTQEEMNSIVNPDDFNCSLQGLFNPDV